MPGGLHLKEDFANKKIDQCKLTGKYFLVGGFNPFEKYARRNGNLPQIGMKIKHV